MKKSNPYWEIFCVIVCVTLVAFGVLWAVADKEVKHQRRENYNQDMIQVPDSMLIDAYSYADLMTCRVCGKKGCERLTFPEGSDVAYCDECLQKDMTLMGVNVDEYTNIHSPDDY